jgi:DNA-binding MarR family transcriptional regulator
LTSLDSRADTRHVAETDDQRDYLDDWLDVWQREIPGLDPLTEGIVERIQIIAHAIEASAADTLASFGLDRRQFRLLGRLRSFGAPYQRSAGDLAGDMRVSTGAMTNRLDRMETAGLIRRLPDPDDRRGTLIEPTKLGHARWEEAVGTQARREAMIASVLSTTDQRDLHRLLRRLMRAFPDKKRGPGSGASERSAGPVDAAESSAET